LEAEGCHVPPSATDADLILCAYRVWGEGCVEHLLCDFAFAIWDERSQSLYCARDHFGVKPFYYSLSAKSLVFGNTLDCIRIHPGVSDELNDRAIGDFLLFGSNEDPTTTVFAGIQRLAAAHSLKIDQYASNIGLGLVAGTGSRALL
jgi:asparagine synthase (glutamine-hydrolysing)